VPDIQGLSIWPLVGMADVEACVVDPETTGCSKVGMSLGVTDLDVDVSQIADMDRRPNLRICLQDDRRLDPACPRSPGTLQA